MPNDIKKLDDGRIEVKLETGEVFAGDPLEVTTKLADSKLETTRYAKTLKTELDTLKAAPPASPAPEPPKNQEETQLQAYLLDQQAKALGFKNAEEYKAQLTRVVSTTEEVQNQLVAANFLQACQDFPNTPEAIEALSKKIEDNGWDFSPQSMIAAHSVLVREHQQDATKGYAPLTADQINAQWATQMQQASRQQAPPMISSRAPDATGMPKNEWTEPLDQLRARVIREQLAERGR